MNELENRCAELIEHIQRMVLNKVKSPPFCPRPKGLSTEEIREIAALMAQIHLEAPWLLAEERSA
jgi:hypothetical protein